MPPTRRPPTPTCPGPGSAATSGSAAPGAAPRAGNYDNLTDHARDRPRARPEARARGGRPRHGAARLDSLEFTVMTYRPCRRAAPTGLPLREWGAPQSYMMLDIAALQHDVRRRLHHQRRRHRLPLDARLGRHAGQRQGRHRRRRQPHLRHVWDGGGSDTYDLSAYQTGVRIDLRPGGHSVFSETQLADLGGGPNGGHARGNVFNALQYHGDARSLIENAIGGSGNDRSPATRPPTGSSAAPATTGCTASPATTRWSAARAPTSSSSAAPNSRRRRRRPDHGGRRRGRLRGRRGGPAAT